ncbi:hypothetical protein GCM10009678_10040 [Actinomadura kijaniata]|uniref:hypothetical protein n=1 Tax=Actinomadura kijaniata TaxID=46161 RepID=UPI002FEB22FE
MEDRALDGGRAWSVRDVPAIRPAGGPSPVDFLDDRPGAAAEVRVDRVVLEPAPGVRPGRAGRARRGRRPARPGRVGRELPALVVALVALVVVVRAGRRVGAPAWLTLVCSVAVFGMAVLPEAVRRRE